jgi:peptide-methionine (S)-S-oxide reductase
MKMTSGWALIAIGALTLVPGPGEAQMTEGTAPAGGMPAGTQVITLGGGCFWCLEAIYDRLQGVESVVSGYSGGHEADPTYKEVCTGQTGHAEAVQVTFDSKVVSAQEVFEVFFTMHDPTTLNRQGADVGTQYRSVIFYRDAAQKATAEQVMNEIRAEKLYDRPLVTQLVPFETFYPAEDYHQEYFAQNPEQGYCQVVIAPKVAKFREKFAGKLR